MNQYYLKTLGQNSTKPIKVSRLARRAVQLVSNWDLGILPKAGGYDDQDAFDIELLEFALQARAERQAIEQQKAERKARRSGRR